MLLKNSCFCTTHKSSVSTGSAEQIICILHILCCNGCLVTRTVVSLTTAKFKPLIFSVSGFTLSYTANMFIHGDQDQVVLARTAQKVSSIIACSVVAWEATYPQSCSLATVVLLLPVYTVVTWQWVYMLQYVSRQKTSKGIKTLCWKS
jgi:hypothetical protein